MAEKIVGNGITLVNREYLEATGVNNVISYDEAEILMETRLGILVVKGESMHITNLNLEEGKITVNGYIIRIEYVEDKGAKIRSKGKGIMSKLLR